MANKETATRCSKLRAPWFYMFHALRKHMQESNPAISKNAGCAMASNLHQVVAGLVEELFEMLGSGEAGGRTVTLQC